MNTYSLASDTWDQEEIKSILRVISSGRYTMGAEVAEFESQFAEYFGAQHAVMTNSGSSANLISIAALALHPKYKNKGNIKWTKILTTMNFKNSCVTCQGTTRL